MGKHVLSAGKIIRRKTEFDVPIGPYMKIISANAHSVIAQPFGLKEPACMLHRDNVKVMTICRLCISEEKLMSIKRGLCTVVSHAATKMWSNVDDKQPDIVEFYTINGLYKLYVTIEATKRCIKLREDTIVLYINKVIG